MSKLDIINKSITEIREILGEECASIEQLPDLVRNIAYDPTRSGFTTAFIFSSESHPNTPTGGSLDTATGLVVGVEGGWSQRVEERETTFRMRSTPETSVNNWMSFAIFNPAGVRVTEWSVPANLKGAQGVPGIPGQIGAQGPEGPKGEKGDSSNSYRTVSVYTTTETIDAPAKPIGGKWNLETNEVTPPTTEVGVKWFLNADEPEKNNYLWMSQATFGETGDLINDWCSPFRLTGEAGKNGADGRVTEFIYRLVPDFETYKKLEPWTNKLYSPEYEDDKVPLPNDDLNLSTKWTDQPSGITESMQIEVCCTRTRKGVEQPWSAWSTCIIWSKWGEDGMDGDGVEYIYLVTPDKTNENRPIDSQYVLNYFTPDRKAALDDEYYQQDEFCFNGAWGYTGYDWSDEPKDVGPGKPLEWVMIRKKKKNGKGETVWGEFSDPAIWGRFAEDGLPYLTSFVFTRSIETPAQPTGGSYEKPMPDQSIWSDSVPVISETMKGPVWMSTRVFYAGDINAFDKDWTTPKIIADTHDFQVEYSKGNENGLIPHLDPFTGDENAWRAKQKADYGIVWGDDSEITDPTWMITSSCDNGVWKPWVLTRIKGEKGAAGQNGTSVEVRGKFPTLAAIKEEWREYTEDGTDFYGSTILHNGDAYFVEENGMLYIYNGGFYPGEATTFEIYWAEVQLTGEKGDSFYFYVAYCEILNEGATLYFDTPKKYIGTIVSDKPLEQDYLSQWSSYKNWTKWLGEDGWGQEQIFLLTSKDAPYDPAIAGKKPLLPVNEEGKGDVQEYLPLHGLGDLAKGADDQPDRWADSPLTVSEDYPYCWVVSRSVPEFGAWKGDGPYASLYSRYSYDGKDGNSTISVNLTNDLAVIPMEGDIIDPDFIASHVVTTSLQVFIGDDPVPSDRTTVSIEGGYATWDEITDTITLNFDKLPANINEIPIVVTVDGGSKHIITWKLFKTDTAYEISPDVHVIKRYAEGDRTGQLETKSFDVKVKKWDGEKWIASNKAVFVEITTKEGKQYYSNQSNIVTETSGGTATVNIGEIHDIKAITVYLTNDDKDNGIRISFEDIAIVADGITGPQGPQGLAGLDANASFKSTVFRRGEGPFNAPEGGDYNSPKPTTTGWFESIPDGTALLWASTRIFSSDGKYPQESKWSAPAKMTDTADFDVEFSSEKNPGNPTSNPENWSNSSDASTIWMAVRKAKNGVWGEWQVSKIKGEDGADGHSIVMHETEPTNPEMGDGYVNDNGELLIWDGDSWVDCGKIKGEDAKAPIIGDNNNWQFWDGEKYVDSGHSAIGDDGHSPYIQDGIWWEWDGSKYVSTGIQAEGVDGISNFIHVKYASEVTTNNEGYGITGKFTESNGEEPGKYMGVYVDDVEDDVLDITKYKWTKAEGEDGFGYEYIYQRNNNPVAPIVPTEITADDVAPTEWTDAPSGVNETELYEWVCWRKKTGGEWSKWIGSAENKGVAALWAKFGEKGEKGEPGKDAVISQAMLDQAAANIAQGFYTKDQIDELERNLNDAIENSGDAQAIADAKAALDKANAVNDELKSLQQKFNEDGTINASVLNKTDIYNLSKAALGTDISENGVFAQQIVGLIGTFGSVKADNITGDSISGLVFKSAQDCTFTEETNSDIIRDWLLGSSISPGIPGEGVEGVNSLESTPAVANELLENGSGLEIGGNISGSEIGGLINPNPVGPSWQLNPDGTGWLAQGNIVFDKEGKVHFGSGVELKWGSVTDAPSIPSEDSIQSKIDSAITEDKLSTIITSDFIQTHNILVNAAQINGKLTADKIDVNSLAVQHLNTTPGETKAGTIKIEGDTIQVYDAKEIKEVLQISGNASETEFYEETKTSLSPGIDNDVWEKLTSIQIPESSYTLNISGIRPSATIQVTIYGASPYTTYNIRGNGWMEFAFILTKKDVQIDETVFNNYFDSCKYVWQFGWNKQFTTGSMNYEHNYMDQASCYPDDHYYIMPGNVGYYWDGYTMSSATTLPAGEYDVWYYFNADYWYSGDGDVRSINYGMDPCYITVTPVYRVFKIASNGIRYINAWNQYFVANDNGSFIMRNGTNAVGVDSKGPFVIKNGSRYEIATTGTATTVNWNDYQ